MIAGDCLLSQVYLPPVSNTLHAFQAAREVFTQELTRLLQSACECKQLILVDNNHHYRCLVAPCLLKGSQPIHATGLVVTIEQFPKQEHASCALPARSCARRCFLAAAPGLLPGETLALARLPLSSRTCA